eukprot:5299454-Lingulodinium_polyedra.AAC.1
MWFAFKFGQRNNMLVCKHPPLCDRQNLDGLLDNRPLGKRRVRGYANGLPPPRNGAKAKTALANNGAW